MTTFQTQAQTTARLLEDGWTRRQIRAALASRTLVRIGHGWYADREDPTLSSALKGHARIGCLSGADHHGLWVPPNLGGVHVVRTQSRDVPLAPSLVEHRVARLNPALIVQDVEACLEHIVANHDPETALMVLESAARHEIVGWPTLRRIMASAPAHAQQTFRFFNDRSESGSETRIRLFFQTRGVPVLAQVKIPGMGRHDLLVGDSWIIEADSVSHHSALDHYFIDRNRDLEGLGYGLQVSRPTWQHTFLTWEQTKQRLAAGLGSRLHRRATKNGFTYHLPELHTHQWRLGEGYS